MGVMVGVAVGSGVIVTVLVGVTVAVGVGNGVGVGAGKNDPQPERKMGRSNTEIIRLFFASIPGFQSDPCPNSRDSIQCNHGSFPIPYRCGSRARNTLAARAVDLDRVCEILLKPRICMSE